MAHLARAVKRMQPRAMADRHTNYDPSLQVAMVFIGKRLNETEVSTGTLTVDYTDSLLDLYGSPDCLWQARVYPKAVGQETSHAVFVTPEQSLPDPKTNGINTEPRESENEMVHIAIFPKESFQNTSIAGATGLLAVVLFDSSLRALSLAL